jgi:murein DD-endopeptidase MepM/ murein hydrolase activator NlpD
MTRPGYTIIVHRDGQPESKQLKVPFWAARLLAGAAIGLLAVAVTLAALYGPIVAAAAKKPLLEREAARLRTENQRVGELARSLDESEARYAHLRAMLGADAGLPEVPGESAAANAGGERLYVAPPLLAREPSGDTARAPAEPSVPNRWPLSRRAFRTRGLAAGDSTAEAHQGVDLAVPVGSEVRAAGGGAVKATGNDSAYGLFVLLEHPSGYESMYGHLSRILVARGETVRAGQVIALSGNTGRSTAPHLHFEIRRNGRSVDPMTIVREGV